MEKPDTKAFFHVIAPDYPDWLDEYATTPRMQKLANISTTCGIVYSNMFNPRFFYSVLEHSKTVAAIVWHFTHDRRQTLAGLFHDIATPAFKHCVDFMNGDYITQESTEEHTSRFIAESPEIVALLKRDKIKISDIDNYHRSPIADNDTPQLSADRLEYTLYNALFTYPMATLNQISSIYRDIEVQQNPTGVVELGFKTKKNAREFAVIASKLSTLYRGDREIYSMQFIADILRSLSQRGDICVADLYEKTESEIIDLINNSQYNTAFHNWCNATEVQSSKTAPKDLYYVHRPTKIRYIDPLWQGERISKQCKTAAKAIEKNLSYDMDKYIYLSQIKAADVQ